MLKKITLSMAAALLISSPVLAECNPPPILNEINFHLNAEEWVQTTSAKLVVNINAALNKRTLGQMRQQIMTNLNKIAAGKWHITTFDRSQDSSGLEKLFVVAEARVNESALTNVNAEAQTLSEPGIKYTIDNVDFTPSMADIERAKMNLRKTIYHDAQTEIATLNSTYPNQKYALHDIQFGEFTNMSSGIRAMPMVMMAGGGSSNNNANNAVSNLVKLTADVNIASKGLP